MSTHASSAPVTIVGAGLLGLTIANTLRAGGLSAAELRIVDQHMAPLAAWRAVSSHVGMAYMRSPVVHHIAPENRDLLDFAKANPHLVGPKPFTPPADRPALPLFMAHAEATMARFGLPSCFTTGNVVDVVRNGQHWNVLCADGRVLPSRAVVLALGRAHALRVPSWARAEQRTDSPDARYALHRRIHHVLDPHKARPTPTGSLCIIGAGISGAQAALAAASDGWDRVVLVSKRDDVLSDFDADSIHMGPAGVRALGKVRTAAGKRRLIGAARKPGTLPRDVARALRAQSAPLGTADTAIERVIGDVVDYTRATLSIHTTTRGGATKRVSLTPDRIWLATGYTPGPPWPPLVRRLRDAGLPMNDTHPALSTHLAWAPGLYVAGRPAELQLGPAAANISGGREAAARIVRALRAEPHA